MTVYEGDIFIMSMRHAHRLLFWRILNFSLSLLIASCRYLMNPIFFHSAQVFRGKQNGTMGIRFFVTIVGKQRVIGAHPENWDGVFHYSFNGALRLWVFLKRGGAFPCSLDDDLQYQSKYQSKHQWCQTLMSPLAVHVMFLDLCRRVKLCRLLGIEKNFL